MALKAKHNKTVFGVGDRVKVTSLIKEKGKLRPQFFEGMVIGIKGVGAGKSFTLRKIGAGQIGIERIFPLASPSIEKIEVVRKGSRGVRRAKLYYTRKKHKREIEKIYSRAAERKKAIDRKSKKKKATKKRARSAKE